MEEIAIETKKETNNHSVSYWDYLLKNPHSVGKKIMILFAGRSGSMMLSGLLDGHSHLLTFNYWVDGTLFVELKNNLFSFINNIFAVSVKDFTDFLQKNIPRLFTEQFLNHPYIDEPTKKKTLCYNTFLKNVNFICQHLNSNMIDFDLAYNIIFIAYGKTQNHKINTTTPHLIIQIHGPHADLKDIFTNLKNSSFLVCVRNTIKAIDSYFSSHDAFHIDNAFYTRMLTEYYSSFLAFFDPKFQNKITCIFYEDLQLHTKSSMQTFCKYLNIPYEEILLQETLDEAPVAVYSINKKRFTSGPSKASTLDTKVNFLGPLDVYLIEHLFKDLIIDLGYPLRSNRIQRAIATLIPSKKQLKYIKHHIRNVFHSSIFSPAMPPPHLKIPTFLQRLFKGILICFLVLRIPFVGFILCRKFTLRKKKTPYQLNIIKPQL